MYFDLTNGKVTIRGNVSSECGSRFIEIADKETRVDVCNVLVKVLEEGNCVKVEILKSEGVEVEVIQETIPEIEF